MKKYQVYCESCGEPMESLYNGPAVIQYCDDCLFVMSEPWEEDENWEEKLSWSNRFLDIDEGEDLWDNEDWKDDGQW